MSHELGSNLLGRKVASNDGIDIGVFEDAVIDDASGALIALLVRPCDDVSPSVNFEQDVEGRFKIDARRVEAARDQIQVKRVTENR